MMYMKSALHDYVFINMFHKALLVHIFVQQVFVDLILYMHKLFLKYVYNSQDVKISKETK